MGCREIMGAGAGEEGILSGCSGLIPTELRLEQPATARGRMGTATGDCGGGIAAGRQS
jgi:hypothetical protein